MSGLASVYEYKLTRQNAYMHQNMSQEDARECVSHVNDDRLRTTSRKPRGFVNVCHVLGNTVYLRNTARICCSISILVLGRRPCGASSSP